jgi:hypothetical protein
MVMMGTLPSIVFEESNAPGGTPPSCSVSAGETHIMTFDGLFYDFQASGDFLLVEADRDDFRHSDDFLRKQADRDDFRHSDEFLRKQAGRDFVVQTRQVSLAPMWPNVSANKAVATRMGRTRVALCLAPTRLKVNGTLTQLGDGESLSLPDDVTVLRTGNVYDIRRESGDIVHAVVDVVSNLINVFVGYAPESTVRGLLGNANGNTDDDIATRSGSVLAQPVSFPDLYQRYGESWRVPLYESLLSVCGDRKIERGNPKEPFYANNLSPDQHELARQICTVAEIEDETLLDACTLDVAVLGNETAAAVYTVLPTPIAVMQAGALPNGGPPQCPPGLSPNPIQPPPPNEPPCVIP